MKKNLIAIIAGCVAFAAVYFGVKFVDEYFIGVPVDAVYTDEYSLDFAPDDYPPRFYNTLGHFEHEGSSYDIYAFFSENGSVERRVFVRKDTVAASAFRKTRTVTDTQYGFAALPSSGTEYKEPGTEEILAAVGAENFYKGSSDLVSPAYPQPADLYESDKDVSYRIVNGSGEAAEVSEEGIVSFGTENSRKYYKF